MLRMGVAGLDLRLKPSVYVIEFFRAFCRKKLSAMKIRIHGDYHLGHVLYAGNDFAIIDFEVEPARSPSERRIKRSPIRDVAGMIRSFHYAAYSSILRNYSLGAREQAELGQWADLWYRFVAGAFLRSYLDAVGNAPFIPRAHDELRTMLNSFLLEKAVYELGYELGNRPDWIIIPIQGHKGFTLKMRSLWLKRFSTT